MKKTLGYGFQHCTDSIAALIWVSDIAGGCTHVNTAWLEFTGLSRDTVLGEGWAQSLHPDDRQRVYTTYQTAFQLQKPFEVEHRILHHSGEYRWVLDKGAPFRNEEGEFIGYTGLCVDIDHRTTMELQLQDKVREFDLILNQLPQPIFYKDRNNRVVQANRAASDLLGLPVTAMEGQDSSRLFGRHDSAHADDMRLMDERQKLTGKVETLTTPEGKQRLVALDRIPYRANYGDFDGLVVIINDIGAAKPRPAEADATSASIDEAKADDSDLWDFSEFRDEEP